MIHDPNNPMCKCEKCMTTKGACTPDSADCGDGMCKMCAKKADDLWSGSAFAKKDYTSKQREAMASRGQAMPDGSFPIANAKDLHNAIQSVGRASSYEAAKKHIISRARALHWNK
jgi:hypothetical protein